MARGQLLKTKIKQAVLEASSVQEAIRLGNMKAEDKINEKKSLLASLRGHLGRIIDRIDPLETLAVAGLTIMLQPVVLGATQFATYLRKNPPTLTKSLLLSVISPMNPFLGIFIGELVGYLIPDPNDPSKNIKATQEQVAVSWLFAFTIAVLIFKTAPTLLQNGVSALNVGGMLTGLLA